MFHYQRQTMHREHKVAPSEIVHYQQNLCARHGQGISLRRQCASFLEQPLQLALAIQRLEIRVAANVLLLDVDAGDGALSVDFFEGVLHSISVGWRDRCQRLAY